RGEVPETIGASTFTSRAASLGGQICSQCQLPKLRRRSDACTSFAEIESELLTRTRDHRSFRVDVLDAIHRVGVDWADEQAEVEAWVPVADSRVAVGGR